MKRRLPWIVAALQLVLLAYMAGEREWIARTGEPIVLRTAPIDPRDPMRGDYVRLSYEITEIAREQCRDGAVAWFDDSVIYSRERRDERVYATLEVDPTGLAQLVTLSDRKPESGLFLRGRVDSLSADHVRVRFGVEAFFMQQGEAKRFEDLARGEKAGVPVNVHIRVGHGGLGVMRSYEWEPLGITVAAVLKEPPAELDEQARRRFQRRVIGATVILKNHDDAPRAIVDLPGAHSFALRRDERWGRTTHAPVERGAAPAPTPADVILLAPGATRTVQLDFTQPEWFVVKDPVEGEPSSPPQSIADLEPAWNARFRIEYAPPPPEACVGLPHAATIWPRSLRSRAFSAAGGGID